MKWLANTSAWTPYLPLPRTRNLEEAPSRIDMTTIGNEQTWITICERETQIRSQLWRVPDHDMNSGECPSQKNFDVGMGSYMRQLSTRPFHICAITKFKHIIRRQHGPGPVVRVVGSALHHLEIENRVVQGLRGGGK